MGGGKSSSSPAPPDPAAVAAAQGAANKDAAIAGLESSMIGQETPLGTLSYQKIGTTDAGNPQYKAITTFSPAQQQLLDLQNQGSLNLGNLGIQQLGRISDAVSTPFSLSSLGAAPTFDDAYVQSAKDAILQRNQPQMDRDRQALITSLANQGITDPASAAYMSAIDELNRKQNDFSLGADTAAMAAATQKFGAQEAARQQAIQEYTLGRNAPLSEYAAFMGQSSPTLPQFTSTPTATVQPADITGPTYAGYQGQLSNYNAGLQADAATRGGLFGLGGSLGAAGILKYSDRRLKKNIRKCGTLANGLNLYCYQYIWGTPDVGVIAQEVLAIKPEAVHVIDGFLAVDYSKLDR